MVCNSCDNCLSIGLYLFDQFVCSRTQYVCYVFVTCFVNCFTNPLWLNCNLWLTCVCQLVCQFADQLIVSCWQLVCQLVVDCLVNGLINYLFAIGVQTFSDGFTNQLISVCKLCVNYFERSLSIIRSVNRGMVAIRVLPV